MNHRPTSARSKLDAGRAGLLPALGLAALGLGILSCTNTTSGPTFFTPFNTKQAVAQTTVVRVSERWLAFLVDESTTGAGTNLNVNGFDVDIIDSVPAVVNMVTKTETVLPVAANDIQVLGAEIFFVTVESEDSLDWDGDLMTDDTVLLHWSQAAGMVSFVATLDPAGPCRIIPSNGRLYFVDVPTMALVAPATALNYVTAAAPTTPIRVANADVANTLERPMLMAEDSGILFLALDETAELRNLNGGPPANDADSTDAFVLALLDATDPAAAIETVGLAVEDEDTPVRALSVAPGDWVVGFLVNEPAQGGFNFNNPALFGGSWKPPQCVGLEDADALDNVLFYLEYAAWSADPVLDPPTNTGLVGVDRILAVNTGNQGVFVATISDEADEGTCSLNGDDDGLGGDQLDRILRWVSVAPAVVPFKNETDLVALASTPGGAFAISDLGNRFLCVVDEAADGRDHDGDVGTDNTLVAWLRPGDGNSAVWVYDHGDAAGLQAVGLSWMADRPERDRLLAGFQESVVGVSVNPGGDNDTNDSAPSFARFDPGNANDLDFPGPAIAARANNVGLVFAHRIALYRVDEAADNRDWNGDGQKNDFVLFRTTISTLQSSIFLSTLNSTGNAPAAYAGGNVGAAWLADESMAARDYNNDGDMNDFVIRWMRVGP